jgi:hypothetical protein
MSSSAHPAQWLAEAAELHPLSSSVRKTSLFPATVVVPPNLGCFRTLLPSLTRENHGTTPPSTRRLPAECKASLPYAPVGPFDTWETAHRAPNIRRLVFTSAQPTVVRSVQNLAFKGKLSGENIIRREALAGTSACGAKIAVNTAETRQLTDCPGSCLSVLGQRQRPNAAYRTPVANYMILVPTINYGYKKTFRLLFGFVMWLYGCEVA